MIIGTSKRLMVNATIAGALCWGASVQASLLFSDNFDSSGNLVPQWSTYTSTNSNGTSTVGVVNNPLTAPSSPNYAAIASNGAITSLATVDGGANQAFPPQSTIFVDWRMYVPAGNTVQTFIGAFGAGGNIPAILKLTDSVSNPGTYELYGLERDSGGSVSEPLLASGLPSNTWEHWRFGITLDTSTAKIADGTYSVYREVGGNWTPIVVDHPFQPVSNFASDALGSVRFQEFTNGIVLSVDDVNIYNSNPVPEPASLGVLSMAGLLLWCRRGNN